MTDLHARILAELDRRDAAAAAVGERWGLTFGWDELVDEHLPESVAAYTKTASPADALRRYTAARRALERHEQADPWRSFCAYSREGVLWPCEDIRDLARSLGINPSGTEGEPHDQ